MSDWRSRVFRPLEPPRGGLDALRARLDTRGREGAPVLRIWTALGVAAAAAILAVGVVPFARNAPVSMGADVALVAAAGGWNGEPVVVTPDWRRSMAVARVDVGQAGVVYYRFSTAGSGGAGTGAR